MSWQDRAPGKGNRRNVRKDVVQQAREARAARQLIQKQNKCASDIQGVCRGFQSRKRFKKFQRDQFNAKSDGLGKLFANLPVAFVLPLSAPLTVSSHLIAALGNSSNACTDLHWCKDGIAVLLPIFLRAIRSEDPSKNILSVVGTGLSERRFVQVSRIALNLLWNTAMDLSSEHNISIELATDILMFVNEVLTSNQGSEDCQRLKKLIVIQLCDGDAKSELQFFLDMTKLGPAPTKCQEQVVMLYLNWARITGNWFPGMVVLTDPRTSNSHLRQLGMRLPFETMKPLAEAISTLGSAKSWLTDDQVSQLASLHRLSDSDALDCTRKRLKCTVHLHAASLREGLALARYTAMQSVETAVRGTLGPSQDEVIAFQEVVGAAESVFSFHKQLCDLPAAVKQCNHVVSLCQVRMDGLHRPQEKQLRDFCGQTLGQCLWERHAILLKAELVELALDDLKSIIRLGAKRVTFSRWKEAKSRLEETQQEAIRAARASRKKEKILVQRKQAEKAVTPVEPVESAQVDEKATPLPKQTAKGNGAGNRPKKALNRSQPGNSKPKVKKQQHPSLTPQAIDAKVDAMIAQRLEKMMEIQKISERIAGAEVTERTQLVGKISKVRDQLTEQTTKQEPKDREGKLRETGDAKGKGATPKQKLQSQTATILKVPEPTPQVPTTHSNEQSKLMNKSSELDMLTGDRGGETSLTNSTRAADTSQMDVSGSMPPSLQKQPAPSEPSTPQPQYQQTAHAPSDSSSLQAPSEEEQVNVRGESHHEARLSNSTDTCVENRDQKVRYVLDGANIGYAFGMSLNPSSKFRCFASQGVELALSYFNRQLREGSAVAFLPQRFVQSRYQENLADNVPLLQSLMQEGMLSLTPSGVDDDLFLLEYARQNPDVEIVTNDNFADHARQLQNDTVIVDIIKERLIKYMFVGNEFLPLNMTRR